MRRKLVTTIYLEPRQDAALKAITQARGTPAAVLIRYGIDLAIAEVSSEMELVARTAKTQRRRRS